MMQTIPKWKVTVKFSLEERYFIFWVYDAHLGNVLRKIADMQFTENGLEQPSEIVVGG